MADVTGPISTLPGARHPPPDPLSSPAVPRMGRRTRLGARQRESLWPVFARVRDALAERRLMTPASLFATLTAHYAARTDKPFTHIVVDEAQDLGVAELRFLAALAPQEPDALFFAGDLGQRIFQQPFSWKGLGIDVRGRSFTLRVNYRTSHQIRIAADRLLPSSVRDVDGLEGDRAATVSVFNGPPPEILIRRSGRSSGRTASSATLPKALGALEHADAGLRVLRPGGWRRSTAASRASTSN